MLHTHTHAHTHTDTQTQTHTHTKQMPRTPMGSSLHNCTYISHFAATVLNLTGRTVTTYQFPTKVVLVGHHLNLGVELPKFPGSPAQPGRACGSCAGHHGWKPIAGPRAGGFGLLALLEFENTSEANICSWGTSWDVTHKHDLLRWLAGLGMGCLYIEDEYIINDTKPFNLHAEWMLQMTSQSNPWID